MSILNKNKAIFFSANTFVERILMDSKNVNWIRKMFFVEMPLVLNMSFDTAVEPYRYSIV